MRCFRPVLVALAIGLCLLMNPRAAKAHDVVLDSSNPNAGAVVTSIESIELRFTGRVNPKFSVFTLTSADGRNHPLTAATFSDRSMVATLAPVEPLPDGRYRIGFQILLGDGDPGVGTVEFEQSANAQPKAAPWPAELANSATPSPPATPAAAPDESLGLPSWLISALAVGSVLVIGLIVAKLAQRRRPDRVP